MKNEPNSKPDTPDAIFARVVALRHLADQLERDGVIVATTAGWSWARIAQSLGVSRQAAHKRLSYLVKGN